MVVDGRKNYKKLLKKTMRKSKMLKIGKPKKSKRRRKKRTVKKKW